MSAPSTRPTRFKGLGYRQDARSLWRFVHEGSSIGPQFKTKAELLAELEAFARDRGFIHSDGQPVEVVYTVECQPEDLPIKGNVQVSGDEKADAEQEAWVRAQLDAGNEWAWCYVVVRAVLNAPDGTHYEGSDGLGACSYLSREDFCREGGYFTDMKRAALDDLRSKLQAAVNFGRTAEKMLARLEGAT